MADGTVKFAITADDTDFRSRLAGLGKEADSAVSKAGSGLSSVGQKLSAAGGVAQSVFGGITAAVVGLAAKGGIDVVTQGLGKEVAGDGIRVNGIRPGLIDTDMQDDTGMEKRIERLAPTIPIGRGGHPEEVAEAALWLLSDKASYVAATLFNVSGGR